MIEQGVLGQKQLDNALELQQKTGGRLGEILVNYSVVTESQLERALKKQREINAGIDKETTLNEYARYGATTKEEAIRKVETLYNLNYINISKNSIDRDTFAVFDLDGLREQGAIPCSFDVGLGRVTFAIANPGNEKLIEGIKKYCKERNYQAEIRFAFEHEIEAKYREFLHRSDMTPTEKDVVDFVDNILNKGIKAGASDVHLEPREKGLQVRYRVDGLLSLKEHHDITAGFMQNLISRCKILADMNIAERRRPQDGRINDYLSGGRRYDLRVSTASIVSGEKIVFRIFEKESRIAQFSELGFSKKDESIVRKMLEEPYGIIYLAGATGTGKTTTLYAMLDVVNSEEINIYTIEDPIEKSIYNVNQIQVNTQAEITFPRMLRSLLRQDPDILVVGEIRDQETAELSVRSSLTGHLVLSTIHANNSFDAVIRLCNMGVEPYLLSAGCIGIVSQRLVRKLCPECKKEAKMSPAEEAWVRSVESKYSVESLVQNPVWVGGGCSKCNGIGYKGRIAVIEILPFEGHEFKKALAENRHEDLYEYALKNGVTPLDIGVCHRISGGITSVAEAMRVF